MSSIVDKDSEQHQSQSMAPGSEESFDNHMQSDKASHVNLQEHSNKSTIDEALAAAMKKATTIKIPSMITSSASSGTTSPNDLQLPPIVSKESSPAVTSPSFPHGLAAQATYMGLVGPSIPMSANGPSSLTNQNRPSAGTQQHPQLNDALAYLDRVRAEFHDQPDVYNKFLQIMRDFKVNAYTYIC